MLHASPNIKTKWNRSMTYVHTQQVQPLVHCDINKRCILHEGHALLFYSLNDPTVMETLELCQENGKVEDDQVI